MNAIWTNAVPWFISWVLLIAGCGDDSGRTSDAGVADAGVADSGAPDAGPPVCDESFLVHDDGTTVGIFDVVVSEINIADGFVELANVTDADVDLTTLSTHQWCSAGSCAPVSDATVTVPRGGYATIPLPVSGLTEVAGELVLFSDSMFTEPRSVLDYVCWGTGGSASKAVAESAGKWSGPCADAIPAGGSLHRGVDEEGYDSSDYYADTTPTPLDCVGP